MNVVVVDVGVSEGPSGDEISTNANGDDKTNLIEDIVELSFGDDGVEVSDVQRGGDELISGNGGTLLDSGGLDNRSLNLSHGRSIRDRRWR